MDKEMLAALVRLLILLPLICLLAYLTVRFGLGRARGLAMYGAGKRMRVLEQVSLGPKSGLSLVQVGDRYMLFAHQEGCILLVREMDQLPDTIETPAQGWPGLDKAYNNLRARAEKRDR